MLKVTATGFMDGKPAKIIVLGLSHANLDKLREGFPMAINGASVGLADDVEIVIFSGETEQSMQREFTSMIGPNTIVDIDQRLKN